jgi:uncharacterized protein YndB with AHSA1/START domain
MTTTPLRIVRVLPATLEEVFDAWIDPGSLAVWMCPGSVQRAVVDLDARVGGRFRVVMRGADGDYEHTGEYLVLDRPRTLVFTWVSSATEGRTTTVSVELRSSGPGQTELTLTHEGLPDDQAADRHRSGWGDILAKLATHARSRRGHEGGGA